MSNVDTIQNMTQCLCCEFYYGKTTVAYTNCALQCFIQVTCNDGHKVLFNRMPTVTPRKTEKETFFPMTMSAVYGCMVESMGYTSWRRMCAALNINCMNSNTYIRYKNEVVRVISKKARVHLPCF